MHLKKVTAVVEKGPNYIFHLMAVARNGFDSEYGTVYRGSVVQADRECLEEHRSLLSFRDGRSGSLVYLLIFFPAYLSLDIRPALEEYFALLCQGLETGNCNPFLQRYRAAVDRQREWTHSIDAEWLLKEHRPHRSAIARLGKAYIRNFDAYLSDVWPLEAGAMEQTASELNSYLDRADLIGRWEQLLGIEFRIHPYEIVLCSAIRNGPNANSLGYERNVFYAGPGQDLDFVRKFISHEVGTHILFPVIKAMYNPDADPALLYRAFENAARFYNSLILGSSELYPLGPYYDAERFFEIYREIHESEPCIDPQELILKGMARYT